MLTLQEHVSKFSDRFNGARGFSQTRITARLRRDADQHAQSVKEALKAEHAARLSSAIEQSEESAAVACAAQERATRLGENKKLKKTKGFRGRDAGVGLSTERYGATTKSDQDEKTLYGGQLA